MTQLIAEGCQHVEDLHHELHLVSVVTVMQCQVIKVGEWYGCFPFYYDNKIQPMHAQSDWPSCMGTIWCFNRIGYQLTFTNSTHIVSSHHKTTHLKYNYLCIIFSWWLGTLVCINGGHCLSCCGGTLSLFQLQLRRLQIPIQCLLWKSWKLLLVPDAFGTSKLHSVAMDFSIPFQLVAFQVLPDLDILIPSNASNL